MLNIHIEHKMLKMFQQEEKCACHSSHSLSTSNCVAPVTELYKMISDGAIQPRSAPPYQHKNLNVKRAEQMACAAIT